MKIKFALLFCLIFCLVNISEASSFEPIKASRVIQPTATSIVKSSFYKKNQKNENTIILANKLTTLIEQDNTNYNLHIELIDCLIELKKYDEAYQYLLFLLQQKESGNLTNQHLFKIKQLKNLTINKNKYEKRKSPVCVCLSIMSLILDDYNDAEEHIKHSISRATNKRILVDGINTIFTYTQNENEAISMCNMYLSIYKYDAYKSGELQNLYNTVLEIKKSFINKKQNINAEQNINEEQDINEKHDTYISTNSINNNIEEKEFQILDNQTEEIQEEYSYELLISLLNKNEPNQKILKHFYNPQTETEEDGFFNICNLLLDNNDIQNATKWITKMQQIYPYSIKTKLCLEYLKMQKTEI